MKAIIQGEFHHSKLDRENLISRLTDDTDFVFIEGRPDSNWDGSTIGFKLFILGYWIYSKPLEKFKKIYGPSVKAEIRAKGIRYDDDIDLSFEEIYEKLPTRSKALVIILSHLIWLVIALVFLTANMPDILSSLIARILAIFALYPYIIPLSYFSLLIVIETDDFGFRDETMCEYIKNKSKEQELDKVLISCGQDHLYPIEEDLEDDGWKVKSYDSAWAWISPSYWKRKLMK